jgi:hypothetical protein
LLSRALWVLGGTVAATATAWLITSASASADTLPTLPGDGDPVALVSGTVTPVGLPGALPLPADPGQAAARVRNVTGELRTAVGRLGGHPRVAKGVAASPLTVLPSAPTVVSVPVGQSGPATGQTPDRELPTPAATIGTPHPVGHAMARRSGARPSTTPHTHSPAPSAPTSPASWTPVSVPTAPASGGTGAAGPGGLGLIDTTTAFPVPGMDLVRAVPVTTPLGAGTVGRQPGSTPD